MEELLAKAGTLPVEAEQAVEKLGSAVKTLAADRRESAQEVDGRRQQLDEKKKAKTKGLPSTAARMTRPKSGDRSCNPRNAVPAIDARVRT
jgi:hypothetical protein